MEGIGLFDMASITCTDTGSSVMLLGAAWGSDPGGRCWGFVSSKSSCQASLGRGMLEGLLICHSFESEKFSCVARSECSSTGFSISWDCALPHVFHSGECVVKYHMVLGGKIPSSVI